MTSNHRPWIRLQALSQVCWHCYRITTLATSSATLRKKWKEKPGQPCFEIPAEMLEELRALGFSWTKIAELLGVSRWTVAGRVEQHSLGDIRGSLIQSWLFYNAQQVSLIMVTWLTACNPFLTNAVHKRKSHQCLLWCRFK